MGAFESSYEYEVPTRPLHHPHHHPVPPHDHLPPPEVHPVLQIATSLEVGQAAKAAHIKACGSAAASADPAADLGAFARDAFKCSTEHRGRIAMDHSDLKDEDVMCFANKLGEPIPEGSSNLRTSVCVARGMIIYDGTDAAEAPATPAAPPATPPATPATPAAPAAPAPATPPATPGGPGLPATPTPAAPAAPASSSTD